MFVLRGYSRDTLSLKFNKNHTDIINNNYISMYEKIISKKIKLTLQIDFNSNGLEILATASIAF